MVGGASKENLVVEVTLVIEIWSAGCAVLSDSDFNRTGHPALPVLGSHVSRFALVVREQLLRVSWNKD